MTWTKIGAEWPRDPRLIQLPRSVRYLVLEAMVWSNQQGTDGHIPSYALRFITDEPDPEDAVEQLVFVGLWVPRPEKGGWYISGFTTDQPTAAEVQSQRWQSNQRQKRRRRHLNGDHADCDPKYCNMSRDSSRVTNAK